MGDFFDLDDDGKIDCFEGAMRWDMIDHMMADDPSETSEGSFSGTRPVYRKHVYSREDFTYGIINQAMAKGATAETRQKALKRCRDILAEEPPVRPEWRFSKWYVIGAVIGIGDLILSIWAKNPVSMLGAFLLWWFFSLPGIEINKNARSYYEKRKEEYPIRRAFAKEYAEKLEALIAEEEGQSGTPA